MVRSIEVCVGTVIARGASEVWETVADLERLPQWLDEFRRVAQESDGPVGVGTVFRYTLAGDRSATLRLVEWLPGRRYAWDGPPLPWHFGAARPRGFIELEAIDAGHTRLVTCYQPELSGSMALLAPIMKRWLRRQRTVDIETLRTLLQHPAAGPGPQP
jgi:uncharacterized protein YndB with AHSA1/START domain